MNIELYAPQWVEMDSQAVCSLGSWNEHTLLMPLSEFKWATRLYAPWRVEMSIQDVCSSGSWNEHPDYVPWIIEMNIQAVCSLAWGVVMSIQAVCFWGSYNDHPGCMFCAELKWVLQLNAPLGAVCSLGSYKEINLGCMLIGELWWEGRLYAPWRVEMRS